MRGFIVLVLFLYLCSSVFGSPPPWWRDDPTEDVDNLEEEGSDSVQETHYIYGPDIRENVVFTILPELPTQEEVPLPEPVDLPEESNYNGLDVTTTTAATKPDCACSTIDEKLDQLMSKLKDQESKIEMLEGNNKNLLEKIDQVEQQTKVNNVIFLNVRETKNENFKSTLQKVLHVLNRMMKLRINADEISVALRVNSNSTKVRPIVVRFNRFETKMRVLGARNKLNRSNIDISADYSQLVNQRRKDLMPFLLEKRRQGHKAFIVYDKLMVDGVKMSLEELQSEKEEEKQQEEERPVEVNSEEESSKGVQVPETEQEPDGQVEEVEVDPQFQDCDYE